MLPVLRYRWFSAEVAAEGGRVCVTLVLYRGTGAGGDSSYLLFLSERLPPGLILLHLFLRLDETGEIIRRGGGGLFLLIFVTILYIQVD